MRIELEQAIIAFNALLGRAEAVDNGLLVKYDSIIAKLIPREERFTQIQTQARERLSLDQRWQTSPVEAYESYLDELKKRGILITKSGLDKDAFYKMAENDSKIYLHARRIEIPAVQDPIFTVQEITRRNKEPLFFYSYQKARSLVELISD